MTFRLEYPILFAVCAAVALAVIFRLIASQQYRAQRRILRIMLLGGIALLALAAGGPALHRQLPTKLVVMIDVSPSTRGATYRVPSLLAQRLAQLIGDAPYRPVFFSDRNVTPQNGQRFSDQFPEMPSRKTIFTPEPADALVVFTDARFDPPTAAPPTYVIVDPALEKPLDAAVTDLSISTDPNGTRHLLATVHNSGPPRKLTWHGTADGNASVVVPTGDSQITSGPIIADVASAQLNSGDAWPENDAMSIRVPPPQPTQHWWVSDGSAAAPSGWQAISANDLPPDAADYLAASVVALDDVSADSLTSSSIAALDQFVRQLGGGLLILGGPRAFAAGGYSQTPLEALSPMASLPPQPRARWIILVDASGSMAEQKAGRSAWQWACDAAVHLLGSLPPNDSVTLGSFAQDLTWWAPPATANQLAAQPPQPPSGFPTGPTNLQAAITAIVNLPPPAQAAGLHPQPTQLILITDAQASIDDPPALASNLLKANVHVDLLAIAPLKEPNPIAELVTATAGSLLQAGDAQQWSTAASKLAQAVQPPGFDATPVIIHFQSPLSAPSPQASRGSNPLWPRDSVQIIAQATSSSAAPSPIGALWQAGVGRVVALGTTGEDLALSPPTLSALANLVAAPPRDPRFKVSLQSSGAAAVIGDLDAADPKSGALTDLHPRIDLIAQNKTVATQPLSQTAPGIYHASVDNAAAADLAILATGTQILDRLALPTGSAPEFHAIGNDHATMDLLASRTGGQVIDPSNSARLTFPHRAADLAITQYLLAGGVVLLALAIMNMHSNRISSAP